MKAQWLEQIMTYDGTQLRSLFAYETVGILGDSVVAWQGPCQVDFDHMVDMEDLRVRSEICGDLMVHFIVEKFDCSLLAAVGLQRLLAALVRDILLEISPQSLDPQSFARSGDDLYWGEKKLSISIATISPTSSLIHFAVNVTNSGTPVLTTCLQDFRVDPKIFAARVLEAFAGEVKSIGEATQKVRWVK